ncbi:hypothetical protein Mapa_004927 [Marchantia paleacea]|nr:hypothetical protein Mapa_004927 [Marchantia paleacea]
MSTRGAPGQSWIMSPEHRKPSQQTIVQMSSIPVPVLIDGNSSVQRISVLLVEVDLDVPALGGMLLEARQLLPQHLVSRPGAVVSRENVHAGLSRFLVHNNVAPPLVVVDSQSDQEHIARVVLEAQHARRAACLHIQELLAIHIAPGSAAPVGLLHDAVPNGGLGLDHSHADGVRHAHRLGSQLRAATAAKVRAVDGLSEKGHYLRREYR